MKNIDQLCERLEQVIAALYRLSLPDDRTEYKRLLTVGHELRLQLIRYGPSTVVTAFDQATAPVRMLEVRHPSELETMPATEPAVPSAVPPLATRVKSFQLPQAFVDAASADQPATKTPKVFIQYAHVDVDYRKIVKELADRLRTDGLDCDADVYDPAPPVGWQTWMERHIRDDDFVLVACSEANQRRFEKRDVPPGGAGATWEAQLIMQILYDALLVNNRFIPVILRPEDGNHVPWILGSYERYQLFNPTEYARLLARLMGRPLTEKPPVGGAIRSTSGLDR